MNGRYEVTPEWLELCRTKPTQDESILFVNKVHRLLVSHAGLRAWVAYQDHLNAILKPAKNTRCQPCCRQCLPRIGPCEYCHNVGRYNAARWVSPSESRMTLIAMAYVPPSRVNAAVLMKLADDLARVRTDERPTEVDVEIERFIGRLISRVDRRDRRRNKTTRPSFKTRFYRRVSMAEQGSRITNRAFLVFDARIDRMHRAIPRSIAVN